MQRLAALSTALRLSGRRVEPAGHLRFVWLRVAIGLGLIAWLVRRGTIDGSRLLGLARAWPLSSVVLVAITLTMLLTSCRLSLLFAGSGLHLPLGHPFG